MTLRSVFGDSGFCHSMPTKKNNLSLLRLSFRNIGGTANVETGVLSRNRWRGRFIAWALVVAPVVGVQTFMAMEKVAGAMKTRACPLLVTTLICAPGRSAEFSGLRIRQNFELGNLVDVHRRELAAVGARVDVGDAVDHQVVLVVAVAIHRSADAAGGYNARERCESGPERRVR